MEKNFLQKVYKYENNICNIHRMETPKICLNMIVKNEGKIITRLLDSVVKLIDTYVICDTGSTDNTVDIICKYFEEKQMEGKVIVKKFEDFGKTRSYALSQCINEDNADYILLLDADMQLIINPLLDINEFKNTLTDDAYYMMQGNDAFQYKNVRLVRNKTRFYYLGATHEYITSDSTYIMNMISKTDIFINDIGDGGSKSSKYSRDIELLKTGLEKEPRNERYMFYLANSYKDNKQYEEAILYYNLRIVSKGWDQEIWCSHYYKGLCYKHLNKMPEAVDAWLDAFQCMPHRLESIYEIIQHYRIKGHQRVAYHFYLMSTNYRSKIAENDQLFLVKDIYDYKLDYELSILGYYMALDTYTMNNLCINLLNVPSLHSSYKENILSNYKYYAVDLTRLKMDKAIALDTLKENGTQMTMKHSYEFHNSTPSICFHNNQLVVVTRYVNYYIDKDGFYKAKGLTGHYCNLETIETRNMCAVYDITDDALTLSRQFEIKYDASMDGFYKGIEDIRITSMENELYFTGNRITQYPDLNITIEYGKLDLKNEQLCSTLLNIENKSKIEKNWVLFPDGDKQRIIYKWHPLTICDIENPELKTDDLQTNSVRIIKTVDTPPIFKDIRGSTNGVVIDDEIWFIAHIVSYETKRQYYHLFVVLDKNTMTIKRYSRLCTFSANKVEYTLGFDYVTDKKQFIVGYSKNDSDTDFYTIARENVEQLMIDNHEST
jgi:hypothetical protein|uniref:Glycosyltransferase 2-like domain-containing protein n=1 Tax=viral metagenome TaxID=1070528 RepID=A0A6C0IQ76_9ZZZZ